MFGEGFKHVDSMEMLADGVHAARIVKAEIKDGQYGSYIQLECEVDGRVDVNPRLILINDSPKQGFGTYSKEQALEMWNRNMTKIFSNFQIQEGNFNVSTWLGKAGKVTVRPQKKNPQYKELVPYVVQVKQSNAPAVREMAEETTSGDIDIF